MILNGATVLNSPFKSKHPVKYRKFVHGFTVLELVVVIAGLAILASISIPSILDIIVTQPNIDEAKALLNSAIAECLQRQRSYPRDWQNWQPEVLKSRSLPGSYQYIDDKKTCSEIEIKDVAGGDSSKLPMLKFSIINSRAVKESEFSHPDAEAACKSWGNCGGSPSAKYLKECFQRKQECETNLAAALTLNVDRRIGFAAWSGQCTWPATDCGCNKEVWACSQQPYYSSDEFSKCQAAKATAACNAHRQNLTSNKYNGEDPQEPCTSKTWWLNGTMFELESDYQLAQIEKKNELCLINYDKWKGDGQNNTSFMPAGGCTQSAYKCIVSGQMKVFEGTTTAPEDCKPATPPPQCICPPGQKLFNGGYSCGSNPPHTSWSNGSANVSCTLPGRK